MPQSINLSTARMWMKSAELLDITGFAGFSPNLTHSSMRRTIPVAFICIFILLSVLCLTGFIIRKSGFLMQEGEFWKIIRAKQLMIWF